MFRRSEGKLVKNLDPISRIIPLIMKDRVDAQVYYKEKIDIQNIDRYIKKRKQEENVNISYMDIIYTGLVRTLNEKKKLNRFIHNGEIYQRNNISISLTFKTEMTEEAEEGISKITFDGNETILEVKNKIVEDIFNKKIVNTRNDEKDKPKEGKKVEVNTAVNILAKALANIPTIFFKISINILKLLDKYNLLSNKILKTSPFHSSAFITNVGSLGIDAIYHHIYNFGTTSLFLAIGKKEKILEPKYDGSIAMKKVIGISLVCDERICDGYYFAESIKLFNKYMKNPELLDIK